MKKLCSMRRGGAAGWTRRGVAGRGAEPRAPAAGRRGAHAAGADAAARDRGGRAQRNLDQAVKAINTRIDDTNNANRKGFADQKLIIDNMANDVRVIRERTDDTNLRIATLREELEALRSSMLAMQQQQQTTLAPAARRRSQRADRSERAGGGAAARPGPAALDPRALADADVRNRARRLLRRAVFAGDQRVRRVPQGLSAIGVGRRGATPDRRVVRVTEAASKTPLPHTMR